MTAAGREPEIAWPTPKRRRDMRRLADWSMNRKGVIDEKNACADSWNSQRMALGEKGRTAHSASRSARR